MVRICVKAPEIVMSGDIGMTAAVAVSTKAKLESVSVKGDCDCGDAPPEPVITDYVIVIDGSDSYNNKVKMNDGRTSESEAFDQTKAWAAGLINNLATSPNADNTTVALVQFSGIKKLEKTYVPGSDGATGTATLDHYKIEIAPTTLNGASRLVKQATDFEALDGNGQLFLCLQDLAMKRFTDQLGRAKSGSKRRTVLIVVSDEEWDVNHLVQPSEFGGGKATADNVCANVHKAYADVFAVIVRPNRFKDQNEDFISKTLCSEKSNYKKVYTDAFETEMNKAGSEILTKLGYNGSKFFL